MIPSVMPVNLPVAKTLPRIDPGAENTAPWVSRVTPPLRVILAKETLPSLKGVPEVLLLKKWNPPVPFLKYPLSIFTLVNPNFIFYGTRTPFHLMK